MSFVNPFTNDISSGATSYIKSSTGLGENFKRNKKSRVSLDLIAEHLLENNYVLSVLELYTECLKQETDLSKLRDFFSNPTNFELHMNRESSDRGSLRKMLLYTNRNTTSVFNWIREICRLFAEALRISLIKTQNWSTVA